MNHILNHRCTEISKWQTIQKIKADKWALAKTFTEHAQ